MSLPPPLDEDRAPPPPPKKRRIGQLLLSVAKIDIGGQLRALGNAVDAYKKSLRDDKTNGE